MQITAGLEAGLPWMKNVLDNDCSQQLECNSKNSDKTYIKNCTQSLAVHMQKHVYLHAHPFDIGKISTECRTCNGAMGMCASHNIS